MEYLLDTVTLIRYLTDSGEIPPNVKDLFEKAEQEEVKFFISTISFMEILYLSEKNRIPISLEDVIEKVRSSTLYNVISMTADIVMTAKDIEFYELHDRMILATAKYLDVPVISPDKKFLAVGSVDVIWK